MEHESIPLTPLGLLQADAVAVTLSIKPSYILTSPMLRTRQTAEPYANRHGIQPRVCELLAEFSVIDSALIQGLLGSERKPFVNDYWADPNPERRMGARADTFTEFNARVTQFIELMPSFADATVIFGHGIWFGLLQWRLMGHDANTGQDMRCFRRFQQGFPMPNCAIYSLAHTKGERWSTNAETVAMQRFDAICQLSPSTDR